MSQLEFRSRTLTNNIESAESSRVLTFDTLNLREGISLLQPGEVSTTVDRNTQLSQMTTSDEFIVTLDSVF
jgi:hypothetical protein